MEKIAIILNPRKHVGTEVKAAVHQLKENSQGKFHPDNGLAAIFCGISQGKTLCNLALGASEANSDESKLVNGLTDKLNALTDLQSGHENSKGLDYGHFLDLLIESMQLFKSTSRKTSSEALMSFLESGKTKIKGIMEFLYKVYAKDIALSWLNASLSLHSSDSPTCAPLPVLFIDKLESVTSLQFVNVFAQPTIEVLVHLIKLQKQMVSLDAVLTKSLNGSLNASELFTGSKEFSAFVSNQCAMLASLDQRFVECFDKFKDVLAKLSGSKLTQEVKEQKMSLAKLLSKA